MHKHEGAMWDGLLDRFVEDNPEDFLEIENALHEEMAALIFLANSN